MAEISCDVVNVLKCFCRALLVLDHPPKISAKSARFYRCDTVDPLTTKAQLTQIEDRTLRENPRTIPRSLTSDMDTSNAVSTQLAQAEGPFLSGRPQSLRSILANAVKSNAKGIAVVSLHQSDKTLPALNYSSPKQESYLVWSYEQLDHAANILASSLRDLGIGRKMRVAVCLYNGVEWALWFWTCARLGATFVPLDPRAVLRKVDTSHYLQVTRPEVLVVSDRAAAEALQQDHDSAVWHIKLKVIAEHPPHREVPSGWTSCNNLLLSHVGASKTEVDPGNGVNLDSENDVVLIIFTSGTSGLPSACPHTNKSLWSTCMTGDLLRPLEPSNRLLQHLPPSHMFAILDFLTFWRGMYLSTPSPPYRSTFGVLSHMFSSKVPSSLGIQGFGLPISVRGNVKLTGDVHQRGQALFTLQTPLTRQRLWTHSRLSTALTWLVSLLPFFSLRH